MHYTIDEIYKFKDNDVDLEELKIYLLDIFESIGDEINKVAKKKQNDDGNNWRYKKNPSLMQVLSNFDKDELAINYEINKITSENYKTISNNITKSIDFTLEKNIKLLVNKLLQKIMKNEIYIESHIQFLDELLSTIDREKIKNELLSYYKLISNFDNNIENTFISKIRNVNEFYIFGSVINTLLAKNIIEIDNLESEIINICDKINNLFDWEPLDISIIERYINMLLGFYSNYSDSKFKTILKQNLTTIVDNKHISTKNKYEILNLIETKKSNPSTNSNYQSKPDNKNKYKNKKKEFKYYDKYKFNR